MIESSTGAGPTVNFAAGWSEWIVANRLGDWASIVGVAISIIGFAVTLWNVVTSKKAARRAETAARQAQIAVRLFDTASQVATAVSTLDEIRRLHRAGSWAILPDRYSALKRHLLSLRMAETRLSELQRAAIQRAVQNLTSLERQVDKAIMNPGQLSVSRFNSLMSEHADELYELLISIRNQVGGDQDDQ